MSLDERLQAAFVASFAINCRFLVRLKHPEAEVRKSALWQNFYIIDGATLKTLSFPYSPSEDAAWERAAWQQRL